MFKEVNYFDSFYNRSVLHSTRFETENWKSSCCMRFSIILLSYGIYGNGFTLTYIHIYIYDLLYLKDANKNSISKPLF